MKIATILLITLLLLPGKSAAWIAYGFSSGMSRFDVAGYLSERELQVITDGAGRTLVGSGDDGTEYDLVYCSTPQKLYLMRFRLVDSPSVFIKTLQKYQKRYGKPEGLDQAPADWQTANWKDVQVSLIWHLGDAETILLTHGSDGSSAEFQDLSVCQ